METSLKKEHFPLSALLVPVYKAGSWKSAVWFGMNWAHTWMRLHFITCFTFHSVINCLIYFVNTSTHTHGRCSSPETRTMINTWRCLCLQRWRTTSLRTAPRCESTRVWRAWRTTCWGTEDDRRSPTPGSGTRSDTHHNVCTVTSYHVHINEGSVGT